jgi:hypothetical protein
MTGKGLPKRGREESIFQRGEIEVRFLQRDA